MGREPVGFTDHLTWDLREKREDPRVAPQGLALRWERLEKAGSRGKIRSAVGVVCEL
jgi:hypothetical protein